MPRPRSFDEQDVLAKARDQFWAHGYASTSVSDLEAATGLKRSSLYQAFGDKRHLYDRVLRDYQRDNLAYLKDLVASAKTFRGAMERLFRDAVSRICSCPLRKGCLIANATSELASVDEGIRVFVSVNRDRFVGTVLPLARRDAGQLSLKPETACDFVFTSYSGLNLLGKSGASQARMNAVAEASIAAVFT